MKLATLRTAAGTRAARQIDDEFVEVEGYADLSELLQASDWRQIAAGAAGPRHAVATADLEAVVPRPSKIVCVGLNYATHIREMGRELPEFPTLFAKFTETLTGPYDEIEIPVADESIDWEAELVVVMGAHARRVTEAEAESKIGGYTVANDISMRSFQFRTLEWLQGKIWERSTPIGPVMITAEELDGGALVRTEVNGIEYQSAPVNDLVHSPAALVAYISEIITLNPGDLILTGTGGGVGRAMTPPKYLVAGDEVRTSIDGIGVLANVAKAQPLPEEGSRSGRAA